MDLIEILQIVVVPIVVALVATFWANIQSRYRKLTFEKLIYRELQELSPYPEKPSGDSLKYHLQKSFIHQKIFNEVGLNRDFILSIDPSLVYNISQLWYAFDHDNVEQWLHFLCKISNDPKIPRYDRKGNIEDAYCKWCHLIESYLDSKEILVDKKLCDFKDINKKVCTKFNDNKKGCHSA